MTSSPSVVQSAGSIRPSSLLLLKSVHRCTNGRTCFFFFSTDLGNLHFSDGKGMPTGAGGGVGPALVCRPGDPRWVEQSFSKRDCSRFVTSAKDVGQCACGQTWAYHKTHGVESVGEPGEIWAPAYHTTSSPTDAFGTIDFLGGPHPNKAQFIRLGFDSRPELILQLLTREWGLELPKLVISVHGGKANFELNPRLKRVFRKGLLRAAKTTGNVAGLDPFFSENFLISSRNSD